MIEITDQQHLSANREEDEADQQRLDEDEECSQILQQCLERQELMLEKMADEGFMKELPSLTQETRVCPYIFNRYSDRTTKT